MSDTNIGNEAVKKATGKGWKDWFSILDKEGSTSKSHKEIAAWLSENSELSGWWAQMVTVQYERERGMRKVHEKKDGFEAGKSKTFSVPIETIYDAWINRTKRSEWMDDPKFTIRKANTNKSIRITWPDNTNLVVYLTAKGPKKTQISIQHNKLKNKSDVKERKIYWQKQIQQLSNFLNQQEQK